MKVPFVGRKGDTIPTVGASVPPAQFRDRFQRLVQVGDLVVAPSVVAPVFRVTRIERNLDPRVQGDTIVEMVVTMQFTSQGGRPHLEFVRVATPAEFGVPVPPPADEAPDAPPPPEKATTIKLTDGD